MSVYIPEPDGSFQGLPKFHAFLVEGTDDFSALMPSNTLSSCTPKGPAIPTFRFVLASKKVITFWVKIVGAHMTWDGK